MADVATSTSKGFFSSRLTMDRKARIKVQKRSAYNVYRAHQQTDRKMPATSTHSVESEPTVSDSETRTPRLGLLDAMVGDHSLQNSLACKQTAMDQSPANFPNFSSDDDSAPAPPDFSRRGIHIPSRTSSRTPVKLRGTGRDYSPSPPSTMLGSRNHGSADSVISYDTTASSAPALPSLQAKVAAEPPEKLEPLLEDDPGSFDLLAAVDTDGRTYSLEARAGLLFSREHLHFIFNDSALLFRFTSFLSVFRPDSVPLLIYYLDALKALRAINYANAVAEALEPLAGLEFTEHPARPTVNPILEERATLAFDALVREDLPAYITHVYVKIVSMSIQKRVTGTLPPHLRESSEGLAEVFCLSDPSRPDNPIVFASEEFHRTTQYGVRYAIGRNCRFLQGPKTDPFAIGRIKKALDAGKDLSEVFVNYRRDGSAFMNLLLVASLYDSQGQLRYYLGAQVDVSGLVRDCIGLDGFRRVVEREEGGRVIIDEEDEENEDGNDEFRELSEMFNAAELETVRQHGGHMHREYDDEPDTSNTSRPRLLIRDQLSENAIKSRNSLSKADNSQLHGVYQHYLLVRPAPSLRILFTSPSLRVPGILQCPLMDRIGGSSRVRDELTAALAEGRGVTAKVRWLSTRASAASRSASEHQDEGRNRWLHCTPLMTQNGSVGVWMIVLVDDEKSVPARRFRPAPPVAKTISTALDRDRYTRGSDREDKDLDDLKAKRHHRRMSAVQQLGDEQRAASPAPTTKQPHSVNSFALD